MPYKDKEKKKEYDRLRYATMREDLIKYQRTYSKNNALKIKERKHKYYLKNKSHCLEVSKTYYKENKPLIIKQTIERNRRYRSEKLKTDILFRLSKNLRSRTTKAFQNIRGGKPHNTLDLLGADYNTVKQHIESQFKTGMSWENYGYKTWHIDHIIPLASAKNKNDLIRLCHYLNLQPLWTIENLSKSKKTTLTKLKG